jgi:L-ascorbate metabolism protein UlaG (beta-lactamase superfamily)
MNMSIAKAPPVARAEPAGQNSLQIQWFGTSCFALQFGDKLILTDPFLTHQSMTRTLFRRQLRSDPELVARKLKALPRAPDAIFVGHSHYDHILDAPEVLTLYPKTPIYGSVSVRNVLCGSGKQFTNTWKQVQANGEWQQVASGIRYKALSATHARQVKVLPLFYRGHVNQCQKGSSVNAYKAGETYVYAFELVNGTLTNVVYFAGAAHHGSEGFSRDSLPAVNLAILPVASWKNTRDYPREFIERLQPQHIIASHYNSFFQTDDNPPRMFSQIDMSGFLTVAQEAAQSYSRFVSLNVPAVGSLLLFEADKGLDRLP